MPEFICITRCILNMKTTDGKPYPKPYEPGHIFTGKEMPNHHFVPVDPEGRNKDPWTILSEKLKNEYGMYVDDDMTFPQLEKMLAEKRAEDIQKDDARLARDFLEQYKIKVHHRAALPKMLKTIKDSGLWDEYMKFKKGNIS